MDPFDEVVGAPGFNELDEEIQINHLRTIVPEFDAAWKNDHEGTLAFLREKTGKGQAAHSETGEVIRQFGSGLGESFTDTAAFPFEVAEWVASQAGSEWRTGVDEAIEGKAKEWFPEATTDAGKVARMAGQGVGIGVQTYMTGGAMAATKLPYVARAGQFLTGKNKLAMGIGTEMVSGGVGGGVGEYTMQKTDDPWIAVGAGMLAGIAAPASIGVGISARRAMKRSKSQAGKTQPPGSSELGSSSPGAQAAIDAADDARTSELKSMAGDGDHPIFGFEGMDASWEAHATNVLDELPEAWKAPGLHPDAHEAFLRNTERVLEELNIPLNPRVTHTSQLMRVVEQGLISREGADAILTSRGGTVTLEEAAHAFGMTNRRAARYLGATGASKKRVKAAAKRAAKRAAVLGRDLTEEELAEEAIASVNTEGKSLWSWIQRGSKRLENVRRGALVTQIATAMRNAETQMANLSVHGMEDAMEFAIQKLFNFSPETMAANPVKPFGSAIRLFTQPRRSKQDVDNALEFFASEEDAVMEPLFSHYASDLADETEFGKDVLGKMEWLVRKANFFNRFQEYNIRRAVFTNELDLRLRGQNTSLHEMVENGRLADLDRADVEAAVDKALDLTWGKQFDSHAGGYEGAAGSIIDAINKAQLGPFALTQVFPFPRFVANALEWQMQRSPLGYMNMLLDPQGWQKLRNGEIKPLIRATTGSAMLWGAHQIRKDQPEDAKWYELYLSEDMSTALGRDPNKYLDTRPFNPFSSYLFAADVINRMQNDRLHTMTMKDLMMGVLSTNLRAGAGLYVLDTALDSFAANFNEFVQDKPGSESLGDFVSDYVGAAWSGLFVPFQPLVDVAAHFDESQRVVRDQNADSPTGAFKRKIPYADDNLPPVEALTQEADITTEAPLLRQLTGLTDKPAKNIGKKELDKFGFSQQDLFTRSGNDEFDRIQKKHFGHEFERQVFPMIQTEEYQSQTDAQKAVWLKKTLANVRKAAKTRAIHDDPELYAKTREGRKEKWQRRLEAESNSKLNQRSNRMERRRVNQQ